LSSSDSPLVSVVMPNLNKGAYVRDAIESVLNQSHQDFELIIVDNGSTDESLAIAEEYAGNDQRIALLHEPRKGATRATNTGMEHAKGDLISLLGSDDVYQKEKLTKQIEVFRDPGVHVSYTDGWKMDYLGKPTGKIFHRDITRPLMNQPIDVGVLGELLKGGFDDLLGSSIMFRRECLQYATPDPELTFYDDWDFWVRLARRFRFGYVPEPLYGYRVYAGNSWADLNHDSLLEAELVIYKKWLKGLDGLDRESRKYIVQNECKCYLHLHSRSALLRLALRNNEAGSFLSKRLASSLARRAKGVFQ